MYIFLLVRCIRFNIVVDIIIVFILVVLYSNPLKGGVSSYISIVIIELFKDLRFIFLSINKPPRNIYLILIPLKILIMNTIVSGLFS
jgi:hypothetical protein